MFFRCLLLLGLCVFLTASPELFAQDGGHRDRGWGNRNPSGKQNADADSNTDKTASAVPGFGKEKTEKTQVAVQGFGESTTKSASTKKNTPSKTTADSKSTKNPNAPSPASNLDDMIRQQARSLLAQYDNNKNGKLEHDEWHQMHRRHWGADKNRDGVITLDELTTHLSQLNKPPGSDSGRENRPPTVSPSSPSSNASYHKPYRSLSSTERLPEGLPDWFAQKDTDGDGQISMAEYSSFWNDAKARDFCRLDADNDGIITPAECLTGEKK
jgi:Ca2+-binding EF-hand superfamily protein